MKVALNSCPCSLSMSASRAWISRSASPTTRATLNMSLAPLMPVGRSASDGQRGIGPPGGTLMGQVDALPADFRPQPDVHPGVAGGFAGVAGVAGVDIAAHVASRHTDRSRRGDVDVGVVLADPFAALE